MTLADITRAAKFVTAANAALFTGALITAIATLLSIRYNHGLEELKDSESARLRVQDQQKIEEAIAFRSRSARPGCCTS